MLEAAKMKRAELFGHLALFAVAYAGFVGYYYRGDKAHRPSNSIASVAASTSAPSSAALPIVQANALAMSNSVPLPQSEAQKPPQSRIDQRVDSPPPAAYAAPSSTDEAATLSVMMSDPDPEVARLAREMYNTMALGR
jgi:hypothetical protein